jgi:hypothetical protein
MRRPRSLWLMWLVLACLASVAGLAMAQSFTWNSGAISYGDNTEFFNPYRTGETILGAQFQTYISADLGPGTEIILGAFGDHRSGRADFLDQLKPLLGFATAPRPRSASWERW